MKTLIFILFSLTTGLCYSQGIVSGSFEKLWWDFKGEQIKDGSIQYADYKGTPYILETTEAAVVLDDNERIEGLTIRYNVYNDQMEIKRGDIYYNIPLEQRVQEIHLDKHIFSVQPYERGGNIVMGYFESIVEDEKCSLFLRHNMFLKEAESPKPFQEARPAEFNRHKSTSFIKIGDGNLASVHNKKDFLALIPDKHTEIARFIKKHKVKFREPESVLELVKYYNSL